MKSNESQGNIAQAKNPSVGWDLLDILWGKQTGKGKVYL
jgi:hypothetical protein